MIPGKRAKQRIAYLGDGALVEIMDWFEVRGSTFRSCEKRWSFAAWMQALTTIHPLIAQCSSQEGCRKALHGV